MDFDPARRYRLSPRVHLRPESFGALAYHFANRRLTFLKTPLLVAVVRCLGDHASVLDALRAAGVPDQRHAGYVQALASLHRSEVIDAC